MNGKPGERAEEPDRITDLSSSYAGARAVVTGATGFIGRWVTRALQAAGAEVFLIVRDAEAAADLVGRQSLRAEILWADLGDTRSVDRILGEVRPHIVFNLAGYGVDRSEQDPEIATAINSILPGTLVEALARSEAGDWTAQRLIHVGSALEYGTAGGNLHEETSPSPTTLYGRTKTAGTEEVRQKCRSLGVRGLTARLFTVYGAGEHPGRLLPTLLHAASTGAPISLSAGRQRRDFTYVEDIAEGLLRLGICSADPGTTVNLATGRLTSVREFSLTAATELGIPVSALRFGELDSRPEEMAHDPVSTSRLRSLTGGWLPRTGIEEGIRRTLMNQPGHHQPSG